MIHYHGTPITPLEVLYSLAGRHFCVSFERPDQLARVKEQAQSVMLDNGAFSVWRRGVAPDWNAYYEWVERSLGPADWAVIPDVIDGDSAQNDALLRQWPHGHRGAPVWHLHEPIARLLWLVDEWPLVCFGSSGAYSDPLSDAWQCRMDRAFNAICRHRIFTPRTHGLRMMACSGHRWPFASVDSTDIARNHSRPHNSALRMAERWDAVQCPSKWGDRPEQPALFAEVA